MVKNVTRKLFKGDKVVWAVFFILCALSLIEVFSASSRMTYEMGSYWKPITKHALFLIAGIGVVWFFHNMKLEWIRNFSKFVYVVGVVLLIYAFVGGDRVNDSARWVTILGVRFQPSEIAKLAIIVFLARCLTTNKEALKTFSKGLQTGVIALRLSNTYTLTVSALKLSAISTSRLSMSQFCAV